MEQTMPELAPVDVLRRPRAISLERRSRWSWLSAAVLLVLIAGMIAIYARDQFGRRSTDPVNDQGPKIVAPANLTASQTPTPVELTPTPPAATVRADVASATATPVNQVDVAMTATPNSAQESAIQPTVAPPTSAIGCDGISSISRMLAGQNGEMAIALLRIELQPGGTAHLAGVVGPVCVEFGEIEVQLAWSNSDWQPFDPTLFGDASETLGVRATDAPASVLVGVTGPAARRVDAGAGATVIDLGGGALYSEPVSAALLRIDVQQLEAGQTFDVDTGQGGAVVVAVETGSVTVDQNSGGSNQLTSHSGVPLTIADWIATEPDEGDLQTIPVGFSMLAESASLTLTAGEQGATIVLLTADVNSARLSPEGDSSLVEATIEATATQLLASLPACTTAPLSEDSFDAFKASLDDPAVVEQLINRPRFGVGDGVAANDEIAVAVTERMKQFAACFVAGDPYRFAGSNTMAYLSVYLISDETTYADLAESMSTDAPESMRVVVWDVRLQADGRATAKVELDGQAMLLTFANVDGLWLIDDMNEQVIIEPAP